MPELGNDATASAIGVPVRRPNAWSIPSSGHESRNEDALLIDQTASVAGVYDGMGGLAKGAVASRIGRDVARNWLGRASELGLDWPRRVIEAARVEVQRVNATRRRDEHVGSTAVVSAVAEGTIAVAWCGDSRAYALYDDGRLEVITSDHNLVNAQLRDGVITPDQAAELDRVLDEVDGLDEAMKLDSHAAYFFFNRNVVSSGLDGGPIDEIRIPSAGVAAVILTSDGVHDNLRHAEVQRVTREAFSRSGVDGVAEALVTAAKQRAASGVGRAKPDDITAVALPVA